MVDPTPDEMRAFRDQVERLADEHSALIAAMHSVWLHGDWRWLTRNMATEEREAAANAVQTFSHELDPSADPLRDEDIRWWR